MAVKRLAAKVNTWLHCDGTLWEKFRGNLEKLRENQENLKQSWNTLVTIHFYHRLFHQSFYDSYLSEVRLYRTWISLTIGADHH